MELKKSWKSIAALLFAVLLTCQLPASAMGAEFSAGENPSAEIVSQEEFDTGEELEEESEGTAFTDEEEKQAAEESQTAEESEETQEIQVKVSVSKDGKFLNDKDGNAMAGRTITLTGKNSYTMDDVLKLAHDLYYPGGSAEGYDFHEDETGNFDGLIYKLWGYDRDSVSGIRFVLNNDCKNYQESLTQSVDNGDSLHFYIQQRKSQDRLAFFTETEETITQDEHAELHLRQSNLYGTAFSECSGASIYIDGVKQDELITDSEGKVTLPLLEVREKPYFITAEKLMETEDGNTTTAISAAYANITVVTADGKNQNYILNELAVKDLWEGEGTAEKPYCIGSAADLEAMRDKVNTEGYNFEGTYFQLTEDITLPENWKPVGVTRDGKKDLKNGDNLNVFSGVLDGNDHTIIVPEGGLPLFGYVRNTEVRNLNIYGKKIEGYGLVNNFEGVGLSGSAVVIDNVTLKSGSSTLKAGFIGANKTVSPYAGCSSGFGATIKNCTIEKGVVIGYDKDEDRIGSFAGRMQGTITNCVSYATVYGKDYVGGIIGTRDNAMGECTVTDCKFYGDVIASGQQAGGIMGGGYDDSSAPNGRKATIDNCMVEGTVTGQDKVGGILGSDIYVAQAWNNCAYTMKNNAFAGKVKVTGKEAAYIGGIIGFYDSLNRIDDIENNFYAADCGAEKGIGFVKYVDTSCTTHETASGAVYFNTEINTSDCPAVTGCWWLTKYNRTDDPLGADAEKLTRKYYVEHTHKYVWKTIAKATVFRAAKQEGTCSVCGEKTTRNYGSKLKAVIKLNLTSVTLQKKQSTNKVKVTMAYGDSVKSWTSSNKKIVTVDKKGVLKAQNKTGTTKVTVTLKSGKKATLKVKVQTGKVRTAKISGLKSAITLKKGTKVTLKPVISPVTSREKVTYTISNKKIVAVNTSGVIYGKKKGTAYLTVSSGQVRKKIKITVK